MEHNAFKKNTLIWEDIYKSGGAGANLQYPCEDLVVATNRYLSKFNASETRVLDIGFGSGNNILMFARKGFNCYGVDVSHTAIEITKNRFTKENLRAELKQVKENLYPFDYSFFDVVVAWHVLCYNDEEGFFKSLTEINRVLKPGGALLATIPTFKEYRIAYGKKITQNTFRFTRENSNQDGAIVIAAEKEEDVRKMFSLFSDLEIGYSEITVKGITNSHWLIYGKK